MDCIACVIVGLVSAAAARRMQTFATEETIYRERSDAKDGLLTLEYAMQHPSLLKRKDAELRDVEGGSRDSSKMRQAFLLTLNPGVVAPRSSARKHSRIGNLYPRNSETRYRNPKLKPKWYKDLQRSITPAQKRAERALWPQFGLRYAYNKRIDLDEAFKRTGAPTVLEIGCGAGEAIITLAEARPDWNFLGVDWFRSGLAVCLTSLEDRGLTNVRLVRSDAATFLSSGLPVDAPLFNEVKVFFPDPWHGSPERRIIRPDVVRQISRLMRPSGTLHVATDVAGYPDAVREVFASPQSAGGHWTPIECADHQRPSTHYSREALDEGRDIEDLHFMFHGLLEDSSPSLDRVGKNSD